MIRKKVNNKSCMQETRDFFNFYREDSLKPKALCTRERIRTLPFFFGSDPEFFRRVHGSGYKWIQLGINTYLKSTFHEAMN